MLWCAAVILRSPWCRPVMQLQDALVPGLDGCAQQGCDMTSGLPMEARFGLCLHSAAAKARKPCWACSMGAWCLKPLTCARQACWQRSCAAAGVHAPMHYCKQIMQSGRAGKTPVLPQAGACTCTGTSTPPRS